MPCYLQKHPAGGWVVYNYNDAPVGLLPGEPDFDDMSPDEWQEHVIALQGFTPAIQAQVDFQGKPENGVVTLYDKETHPIKNLKNMQSYLQRLSILAKLKVEVQDCPDPT